MAGLKDRVLALLGRGRKGPGLAGWVRVDSDGVIRGWVVDAEAPGRRLAVDVRVDGQTVAAALADRLDPKLISLGHGDGRHAFEAVVPGHFRDGASHRFEAFADGYRLMSKAASFTVSAADPLPDLRLSRIGTDGLTGSLSGPQTPGQQLELWSGGSRLEGLTTTWRPSGPLQAFSLAWPPGTLLRLGPDAELAAPGLREAGLALRIFDLVRLRPVVRTDHVEVAVEGPLALPPEAEVILSGSGGKVVARGDVRDGRAIVPLAVNPGPDARLRLELQGQVIGGLDTPYAPAPPSLVDNGAFRGWREGLPTGWSVGPGVDQASRAFYAFPQSARTEAGGALSGEVVRLEVAAGPDPLLLHQEAPRLPQTFAAAGDMALMARASASVGLDMVLVGEDGQAVQTLALQVSAPWAWTFVRAPLGAEAEAMRRVELRLADASAADLTVEVALVQVGGAEDGGGAAEAAWGLPANLVENGDLTDWPGGLTLEGGAGRTECAAGWFVQNRKAPAPVMVRAWSGHDGGFGMAIAAAEVSDYCRLEARLHPAALTAGPRLRLSFEAAIPTDAPEVFQSRRALVVIERVFLLRRGRKPNANGFSLGLEVIATLARRLAVGRDPQRFSFELDVAGLPPTGLEAPELTLAFDFNTAFSLLLRDVVLAPAPAEPAADPGLELEDPAITLQASSLKGLAAWLSPEPVAPGPRFEAAPEAVAHALRWSPPSAGGSSVEVVVCVHDAAEEALACLGSLVAGSTLPHIVRIIDDASGEDTRRRLLDFIADKPWMRMISNAENRGYTASANLGIRGSSADWVILLNSDTVVTPGWIEGLLECAASDPTIAMVGPMSNAGSYQSLPELKDRQGRWKVNALPPGWTPRRMADYVAAHAEKAFAAVPLLNGFCTLIRRDAFMALGGFNEAAFPQGYGEENDLCVRAAAAGYRLAVADHVYVYHAKSASFGSARRAELQKAAGKALATLHPDTDFSALGDRLREVPALSRLRAKVRELYEAQV